MTDSDEEDEVQIRPKQKDQPIQQLNQGRYAESRRVDRRAAKKTAANLAKAPVFGTNQAKGYSRISESSPGDLSPAASSSPVISPVPSTSAASTSAASTSAAFTSVDRDPIRSFSPIREFAPAMGMSLATRNMERDSQMFRLLLDIQQHVKQNTKQLHALIQQQDEVQADDVWEDDLPVKTYEDLEELEGKLKDKSFKRDLIRYLGRLGGLNEKEVVNGILRQLMTDDLAMQLNWAGRGHKRGLGGLILAQVIIRAAKRSWSAATSASVEKYVKPWLKYSIDRNGGRKMREEKKKAAAAAAAATATGEGVLPDGEDGYSGEASGSESHSDLE